MLVYLLASLVGLSLGFLGAGGSIFALPILRYAAGLPVDQAVATSLATVGAVSAVGAAVAWQQGRVCWRSALSFSLLASLGTAVGVKLASRVPDKVQMGLFLVLMGGAVVAMLRRSEASATDAVSPQPPRMVVLASVLGVGMLTGLVGVGGGFLIVPAMVAIFRLPVKKATGTSLAAIALNSLTGVSLFASGDLLQVKLTLAFTSAALLGLGVGLTAGKDAEPATVERVFVSAVAVVALTTIAQEFFR